MKRIILPSTLTEVCKLLELPIDYTESITITGDMVTVVTHDTGNRVTTEIPVERGSTDFQTEYHA